MTVTQSGTANPFAVRIGANLYAVEFAVGPLVGVSGGTSAATIDDVGHRILIDNKLGAENAAQVAAAVVATAWQQVVTAYGERLERAWAAFDAMTEAVDLDLDGELTEDDAGAVFAAFERLRKLGVRFDPPFVGRMVELERVTAGPRHEKGGTSSESFIDDDDDGPADDADDRHEYAGADDPDEARKLCHRDDQPALAKELARLAQGRRQRPHPTEPSLQVEQHPTPPGGAASPATKPRGPEMLFTIVKHYTNDDPDDEREWFRWVAIPAALRDSDGTPREADNVLYFSVSKAAILTNWNLSGLALNWGHAIGPECTPEERRAIGIQAREIHERYCCYSPVRDEAST